MECPKCYAYVHDTLHRPYTSAVIRHRQAMKHAHILVPELIRLARGEGTPDYLAILFVEAGGVRRLCLTRTPLPIANLWVRHQLRSIGNLNAIHAEHTRVLHVQVPMPDVPPGCLRIRIPIPVQEYASQLDDLDAWKSPTKQDIRETLVH